jgi:hypothetical protein
MPTSRRTWSMSYVIAAALVLACASSGTSGSAPQGRAPKNSDVITREELADPSLAGDTVLEVVRRLRPRFVNDRGGSIGGVNEGVQISINGGTLMALGELGRLGVSEVTEIRYLSTADAGLRFGLRGSMGPVLLVTTTPR